MKAAELRINNYVSATNDGAKFPYVITAQELVYFEADEKRFKPIPITYEWLINLGFKKVPNGLEIDCGNGIRISSLFTGKPMTLDVYGNRSPLYDITYIHQIQNLYFALAGKEII